MSAAEYAHQLHKNAMILVFGFIFLAPGLISVRQGRFNLIQDLLVGIVFQNNGVGRAP